MLLSVRTAPALLGDELHVRVREALQHLVRPDDVERGDAVEQEAGDVHGCSL